eukprot:UN00300
MFADLWDTTKNEGDGSEGDIADGLNSLHSVQRAAKDESKDESKSILRETTQTDEERNTTLSAIPENDRSNLVSNLVVVHDENSDTTTDDNIDPGGNRTVNFDSTQNSSKDANYKRGSSVLQNYYNNQRVEESAISTITPGKEQTP